MLSIANHSKNQHRSARLTGQSGMSLIEVLVSMLIISIGVLGMIATQANAMRFLQSSHSQGAAAMLADDLANRIRANTVEAINNDAYVHRFSSSGESSRETDTIKNCAFVACSTAELASWDLEQWQQTMMASLPSSSSVVTRSATAGTGGATTHDFLITLRWDDDRDGSTGTECDADKKTSADLDCWQMTVSF